MQNLQDPLILITWIFGVMNLIVFARYGITGDVHMGVIGFLGPTFGALLLTIRVRDARRKIEPPPEPKPAEPKEESTNEQPRPD